MLINIKKIFFCLTAAIICTTGLHHLKAQEPTAQLKKTTQHVINTLTDEKLSEEKQLKQLRNIVNKRFDWPNMSRRALGHHWLNLSDKNKEEFTELFSRLLEDKYLEKLKQYSDKTEIEYKNEKIDKDYASIDTIAKVENKEKVYITYRLHREQDKWLVHDVVIENVSLVNNYRSQFNSMLARMSFEKLLDKIRAKVAK